MAKYDILTDLKPYWITDPKDPLKSIRMYIDCVENLELSDLLSRAIFGEISQKELIRLTSTVMSKTEFFRKEFSTQ